MEKSILVPYDLTEAARRAVDISVEIAKKGGMNITLLFVQKSDKELPVADELQKLTTTISGDSGVNCDYVIRKGNLFTEIEEESGKPKYTFMVAGSHGYKGFKDKFLGMDILKLVKNIPMPVLTVQEGFSLPSAGIRTILMPASSHEAFGKKIEATVFLAQLFGATVHVYTVEKPGFEWSAQLKENIGKALTSFESNQIKFERVNEHQTVYSPGYAKQILDYAGRINADIIAVMSVATDEYYYIADSDKERLLTNESKMPVLCVSGKKKI